MNFRDRINRFMQGRCGVDDLSRFLMIVTVVLIVVTMFFRNALLEMIPIALLIYTYYRILSKNHSARAAENQKYLGYVRRLGDMKTHHIYKCPNCGQKIRIPRGKGKIEISCPKCQTKFVKKS